MSVSAAHFQQFSAPGYAEGSPHPLLPAPFSLDVLPALSLAALHPHLRLVFAQGGYNRATFSSLHCQPHRRRAKGQHKPSWQAASQSFQRLPEGTLPAPLLSFPRLLPFPRNASRQGTPSHGRAVSRIGLALRCRSRTPLSPPHSRPLFVQLSFNLPTGPSWRGKGGREGRRVWAISQSGAIGQQPGTGRASSYHPSSETSGTPLRLSAGAHVGLSFSFGVSPLGHRLVHPCPPPARPALLARVCSSFALVSPPFARSNSAARRYLARHDAVLCHEDDAILGPQVSFVPSRGIMSCRLASPSLS